MQAAGAEMAAVALYLVVMVTLILTGASLGALMAVSGALPLLSGGSAPGSRDAPGSRVSSAEAAASAATRLRSCRRPAGCS